MKKGFTIPELVFAIYIVAVLLVFAAGVYSAIHFIAKFW